MEAFKIAYEGLAVGVEIALQKFTMRHLPSLQDIGGPVEGLVCIVTGPTAGIGKQTAMELARRGAHVILACRSVERGTALKNAIIEQQGVVNKATIDVIQLDLSSLHSVRAFAQTFLATGLPLHILINNAGIFSMSAPRCETVDGFESHIGTNHLGHFLLTLSLMPALRAGSAATSIPSRIVNVSSKLHLMGRIRREDPNVKTRYHSLAAYAQSKLAQVCFAAELTRRCANTNDHRVVAVAVHPGEVVTDVVRSLPGPLQKLYALVMGYILLTPAEGARSSVFAATSPRVIEDVAFKGKCYIDSSCVAIPPAREAEDVKTAAWLWEWSAKAVQLKPEQDI